MFIVDATADYAQALARLARLMYNIERGARVYEWGPGSTAEADPKPQPGFLSISVPGVTGAAPPAVANYRPSVAFVYYVPGVDLPGLVRQVRDRLEEMPDDHLRGYLPVEAAPHATLLHRNRTHAGSNTTGGRNAYSRGWYPGELYPARHFHYIDGDVPEVPSHVSYRGAFTWYFLPISTFARITALTSFEEFNAVVSGVFLDSFLGGREAAEPIYNLPPDFFNIPPAPAEIRKALDGSKVILVHRGGRFYLAGPELRACLEYWEAPRGGAAVARLSELRVANLAPGLGGDGHCGDGLCGLCRLPLWGVIYVVEDDVIAPHRMALCEWCAGCLPPPRRDEAIRFAYPRTMAEAYGGTALAELLPLLEAQVEATLVRSALVRSAPYFRVHSPGKEGGGYFVEAGGDGPLKNTPPCLRVPELREHRIPSIICERLAQVVPGRPRAKP